MLKIQNVQNVTDTDISTVFSRSPVSSDYIINRSLRSRAELRRIDAELRGTKNGCLACSLYGVDSLLWKGGSAISNA